MSTHTKWLLLYNYSLDNKLLLVECSHIGDKISFVQVVLSGEKCVGPRGNSGLCVTFSSC